MTILRSILFFTLPQASAIAGLSLAVLILSVSHGKFQHIWHHVGFAVGLNAILGLGTYAMYRLKSIYGVLILLLIIGYLMGIVAGVYMCEYI